MLQKSGSTANLAFSNQNSKVINKQSFKDTTQFKISLDCETFGNFFVSK
jgi:hypothetical protein